jgi:hypothetical protein
MRVDRPRTVSRPGGRRLSRAANSGQPLTLPINLVHLGQRLLPLKMRVFLDFVAPRIRKRAAKATLVDKIKSKQEQGAVGGQDEARGTVSGSPDR